MKTARDVLDDLLNFVEEPGRGISVVAARQAMQESLRELANVHEWSYYSKPGQLVTSSPQSTGTIAYDHTGGTYERMVTLTGATWPTWSADGLVVIGSVAYQVDEYRSSTQITLEDYSNPGEDVAAGTTYQIYRQHYQLPVDFRAGGDFTLATKRGPMNFVAPRDLHWLFARRQEQTGQPVWYSIIGQEDVLGRMALYLHPAPDSAMQMNYIYQRQARPISTFEYSTNTATTASGSATVTGSGTAWTSRMAGAVIRFGANASQAPTGLDGGNPYQFEDRIAQVVSATSLRLASNAPSTLTAVKYVISDPIDVEDGAMLNAYIRGCHKSFATIRRLSKWEQTVSAWQEAVRLAMAADSRSLDRRSAGPGPAYRIPLRDMPMGSDQS